MNKLLKCCIALLGGALLGFTAGVNDLRGPEAAGAASDVHTVFISHYKSDVQKAASKYRLYASVMMAQAALESDWGQSTLTKEANNFFGIKGAYNGQSVQMPTVEYTKNGQMENINASFRKYPSAYASFADNGQTLRYGTSWDPKYYSGTWKENAPTYESAANALTGTYATAPNYGSSLISLIQLYGLNKILDGKSTGSTSVSKPVVVPKDSKDVKVKKVVAVSSPSLSTVKYLPYKSNKAVSLSKSYDKYFVYNHVQGTSKNEQHYTWTQLGIKSPVWVYVDLKAEKSGSSTDWYRIRFYSSDKSQRFWVCSSALKF